MRTLSALLRRMKWIGIKIEPFVTVCEGESPVEIAAPPATFGFGFLTAADVEDLIRLEPGADREMLNSWFREGKLCYGIRDNSRLIAKMWCDLKEFSFPPNYRQLADGEVYLFAAYSHPDCRGQNLAPLMRSACYASLREMGCSKFYSYTDFFNAAARRFKTKLGAREESVRLHLELFGKWSKTWTLRNYS
jgi:GNAT superfamily N-acetyltransferase